MSLAVMRRDQNPYPKGMAGKKEKVRRQGEVDKIQKRINKQNMAWMTYSLQQKSVDEALKLISQIRANAKLLKKTTKKRARYQGSLLGGTDVSY
jgi:geranylgeranyl pyrophosphate synthase